MLDKSPSSEESDYDRIVDQNDEEGRGGIGAGAMIGTGEGWMRRHARDTVFLQLFVRSQVRAPSSRAFVEVPQTVAVHTDRDNTKLDLACFAFSNPEQAKDQHYYRISKCSKLDNLL